MDEYLEERLKFLEDSQGSHLSMGTASSMYRAYTRLHGFETLTRNGIWICNPC